MIVLAVAKHITQNAEDASLDYKACLPVKAAIADQKTRPIFDQ